MLFRIKLSPAADFSKTVDKAGTPLGILTIGRQVLRKKIFLRFIMADSLAFLIVRSGLTGSEISLKICVNPAHRVNPLNLQNNDERYAIQAHKSGQDQKKSVSFSKYTRKIY